MENRAPITQSGISSRGKPKALMVWQLMCHFNIFPRVRHGSPFCALFSVTNPSWTIAFSFWNSPYMLICIWQNPVGKVKNVAAELARRPG